MPEHENPTEAAFSAGDAPLRRPKHLGLIGGVALVIAVVLVGVGLFSRSSATAKLKTWTNDQSTPTVALAKVAPAEGVGKLELPGQVEAYNSAEVNARVTGYLKTWTVDIGSRVRAGQTLAVLEAPELNQQLLQAKADLTTAEANQRLSGTTNTRYQLLLKDEAASKQDADEKAGDLAAKTALVSSAQANVRRLAETFGFTKINAPFDGVVTARNAQLGQLVVSGSPSQPMFVVADDHKLRIYIHVPQPYIAQLHVGETADLTVPEYADRSFKAVLVRTSDAVDQTNGSLTAELQIDNADHVLKPGEYATAHFGIAAPAQSVAVPASAVLFRDGGTMLGVVGPDNKVTLHKVTIARDLGTTVEISSGVSASDKVVDNPADTLTDGQSVRIAQPGAAEAAPAHG